MKKIIAAFMLCSMLVTSFAFAANNEPKVLLNGEQMTFEVNPFIEYDRTFVPMRAIFEAVGAKVEWDDETRTVHAVRGEGNEASFVSLQIGNTTAFVNGASVEFDVASQIKDDRTFVPLRFVVEALGEKVEWDNDNYTVVITTAK